MVRLLPRPDGGNVPALAVTAYAYAEDGQLALAAGFQLHLAKPVEPAALVSAVVELAGKPSAA